MRIHNTSCYLNITLRYTFITLLYWTLKCLLYAPCKAEIVDCISSCSIDVLNDRIEFLTCARSYSDLPCTVDPLYLTTKPTRFVYTNKKVAQQNLLIFLSTGKPRKFERIKISRVCLPKKLQVYVKASMPHSIFLWMLSPLEYWLIYRGPGFLAVVWFISSSTPSRV